MDQSPAAAAQQLAFNKWKLFRATETGDTDTVVELLDSRGVSVDIKDIKRKVPIAFGSTRWSCDHNEALHQEGI